MIDTQTYMWPQAGNETPRLGKKVPVQVSDDDKVLCEHYDVLMMPLYGTVAEWVPCQKLSKYPSEPIPEPAK